MYSENKTFTNAIPKTYTNNNVIFYTTNLWSLIQNVLNSKHYNYALFIYNTIVALYILYIYIIYHKS